MPGNAFPADRPASLPQIHFYADFHCRAPEVHGVKDRFTTAAKKGVEDVGCRLTSTSVAAPGKNGLRFSR